MSVSGVHMRFAAAVFVLALPGSAWAARTSTAPERVGAEASASESLSIDLGGATLELVLVRAGQLEQGSPRSERGRGDDEEPRTVALSHDYYIGKYEVTVEQFAVFVQATGYVTETERGSSGGFGLESGKLVQSKRFSWRTPGYVQSGRHPVSLVTFEDAVAFTRWSSQRAGRSVELPTEAQWEHAYREGTSTRYYAGEAESVLKTTGWFRGNAASGAQAVGGLEPNAWGLYDMAGNVYEWCRDWYGPYEPLARATDPLLEEPPAGDKPRRVLRGGSFLRLAKDLRAAARYRNDPGSRNADNGFRVVASTSALPAAAGNVGESAPLAVASRPGAESVGAPSSWLPFKTVSYGVFAVIAGVVMYGLFRGITRFRRPSRAPSAGGGAASVRVRPGKDGFWLVAPEHLRGHTLRYRVSGPGGAESAAVELEPSPAGQFVYTGYRPASVSVEQVLLAGGAAALAWNARRRDEDEDENAASLAAAPAEFRRYPSAY